MLVSSLFSLLALPLVTLAAKEVAPANDTIDKLIPLRSHSLYAPYIDQDLQNRWWDFGADAYVDTNRHVRLTRQRPSQMGWLWSRLPLTAANWVVEIEFKIDGESTHLFGDGMAVWWTKDRAEPGPVFGSKDEFTGLGIFLDTYANSRHTYAFPRVTAMLGDGKTKYDHAGDNDKTSIGACSANIRRTNVATKLKITYFRHSYLSVQVQHKGWDEWTECFTLEGVDLPPQPYLGFSALTGDVDDAHDVVAISTFSAVLGNPERPKNKILGLTTSIKELDGGGWFLSMVKFLFWVGVVIGLYYAYQAFIAEGGRRGGGGYGSGMGGGGAYRGGGGAFGGSARGGRFSLAALKDKYMERNKRF